MSTTDRVQEGLQVLKVSRLPEVIARALCDGAAIILLFRLGDVRGFDPPSQLMGPMCVGNQVVREHGSGESESRFRAARFLGRTGVGFHTSHTIHVPQKALIGPNPTSSNPMCHAFLLADVVDFGSVFGASLQLWTSVLQPSWSYAPVLVSWRHCACRSAMSNST